MKLVKLKDVDGDYACVNPEYVVLVGSASEKGAVVPGVSSVVLGNGLTTSVSGTPREVSLKLGLEDPFPEVEK